jgi:hypothetical protein
MDPYVDRPARYTRVSSSARALVRLAAFAIVVAASAPASAAPCAGFNDVDTTSGFCADVQWSRNRAVTQGCAATAYCPHESVTRLQMAAFMSRLGKALQPAFLHRDQYVQTVANLGTTIICQMEADAASFPRVASSASSVIQYSNSAVGTMFAQLVVSTDGGTTWTPWSRISATLTLPAAALGSVSPAAPPIVVPAGQAVRFGMQPFGSFAAFFEDVNCEVTVRLDSTEMPNTM